MLSGMKPVSSKIPAQQVKITFLQERIRSEPVPAATHKTLAPGPSTCGRGGVRIEIRSFGTA